MRIPAIDLVGSIENLCDTIFNLVGRLEVVMASMDLVYIDCRHGERVIASYEFGIPRTLVSPNLPSAVDESQLISQAKDNLANEGLGQPPFFEGIEFRLRRAR